jgi:hypothetical protein
MCQNPNDFQRAKFSLGPLKCTGRKTQGKVTQSCKTIRLHSTPNMQQSGYYVVDRKNKALELVYCNMALSDDNPNFEVATGITFNPGQTKNSKDNVRQLTSNNNVVIFDAVRNDNFFIETETITYSKMEVNIGSAMNPRTGTYTNHI